MKRISSINSSFNGELLPWSTSSSGGSETLPDVGICTCTLKYFLTSTSRVDTDWRNSINSYNFSALRLDFKWTERREWRNEELFTFYSTRASLLLFTNVTSVTRGLNRREFTITENARWQIGRRTSDQVDHSVCALRWQVWWLHRGLSIKISSSNYGFPENGRKQDKTRTQWLIDPPLPIRCLNY